MPTGYTAAVQDGTITEFPEFAMQCARAMGACVTMRDAPSGAAIPEEFQPSQYSNERLGKATTELEQLERATPEEIVKMANDEHAAAIDEWQRQCDRTAESRIRYQAMLEKVREWSPPTLEHEGIKKFMVQQLTESISFDCSPVGERPQQISATEWHARKLAKLHKDIVYHKKTQAEEDSRVAGRNLWLRQLRQSLLAPPASIEKGK